MAVGWSGYLVSLLQDLHINIPPALQAGYGVPVKDPVTGAVIGYAGSIVRGQVAFLTDLFVRAAHQSNAIGQALLAAVMPQDGRMHCTTASTDPRAQALYARAGMAPRSRSSSRAREGLSGAPPTRSWRCPVLSGSPPRRP